MTDLLEGSEYVPRREALRERIVEADLDALLVTRLVNVRYLTGFAGSNGTLVLSADGAADLFVTDGRYEQQAARQVADVERIITRGRRWVAEHCAGFSRLGVESHDLAWDRALELAELLPGTEIVRSPRHVEELRQHKDDIELVSIRRACDVTGAAFNAMLQWLEPGLTEIEIARRLHHDLVELDADDQSFEMIVASGANSARPHHRPTQRAVQAGDLVKVDFGAMVGGYHADMTRVVALGSPDPKLVEIYDIVRQAQQAGLDKLAAGVGAADVDAACRKVIADAGYGDRFVHSTGHGVGLEVHEQPILGPDSDATLAPRMTVTVEPGIYLPGIGGVRIEDLTLIEAAGAEVLTVVPRDLVIL